MTLQLERLLRLFPAPFRRRFGDEMLGQLRADAARARSRGRLRAFGFWLGAAADLAISAIAERFDPTWPPTRRHSTGARKQLMRLDPWVTDLRYALRALLRAPGFVLVTVITLGLAIGANAGLFSVVDTVLLDPLPYRDTDRLVSIAASAPGSDLADEFGVSSEFYLQYREHSRLLEDVAIHDDFTCTLRTADRVERVRMAAGTWSLLQTLGTPPILGRLPAPEDEAGVTVLSHGLWTTWFGADPGVIGRTADVCGDQRTIIAVMPPGFWFPNDTTVLWFPGPIRAEDVVPGRFGAGLVGRTAPGVDSAQLVAELDRLAQQLPERFGGTPAYARIIERHRAVVRPLERELLGDIAGMLWVLLGALGILLLIACANVANLFLVRSERRQRELALQRAIGAARPQLVRTLMAEALIVALLAGVLALVLAAVSVPLFVRAAPAEIPRLAQSGVTGLTVLFTAAAALGSALLCGLVPAIRGSAPNLARLREGGRGATRRRHWGRHALVVAQTALALVLLIGSGLLIRSFRELRDVDPGYDTEDLFTFQIAPEGAHLTDAASYARFHTSFAERVASLPGVESVGLVENVPLDEGLATARFRGEDMPADADAGVLLNFTWAGGDYFPTMGIAVLRGRPFTEADHTTSFGNVVVSELAASQLWPSQDPLGKRLRLDGREEWETVVGVVEDIMQYTFRDSPQPLVYFPLVGQSPESRPISSPGYVVKTARAEEIAPEIRALVREVAPEAPMYRTYTMRELAADSMMQLSFTMLALGTASALALLLGLLGLYGILSYVVAERTQEIGVRMALGAAPRRVQLMVLVEGGTMVALGVLLGLGAALGLTRVLGSLLFGIESGDPATFGGMSAAMALVGLLATYMPARRAATVDPIRSLRND